MVYSSLAPPPLPLAVRNEQICPVSSVRNLGFILDCHMTFEDQIRSTRQWCYFHLGRIARIQQFISYDDEVHHLACVPNTGLKKLAPSWPPWEEHLSAAVNPKLSGSSSNENIEFPIHLSSPCPSSLAACPAKNWFKNLNSCVQMVYWLCSLLFL